MRFLHSAIAVLSIPVSVVAAQTPAASQAAAPTDVYHVMFVKAAPGQAAALAKDLQQPDPKNPMASHFILLRHQEGADWDYCLIEHLGTKPTVEIPPPATNSGPALIAWHEDTFAAGPAWPEFQKQMGLNGDQAAGAIYTVGVHRALPGHRDQLEKTLSAPSGPASAPGVMLIHIEGGPWQFLTIARYKSWQELGADRGGDPGAAGGWLDIRQHSAFHNDTIADRVK